jgi:23S rRNA pseudouridine2604 synthase
MTTAPPKKTLKLHPRVTPPRATAPAPAPTPAPPRPHANPPGMPPQRPAPKGGGKPRMRPITALRTKPVVAEPVAEDATGERLSKRVAAMVPCSRTEAEQYIEGGWVRVAGQVVEEPQFRVGQQAITIDPNASLLELGSITLILHKPDDWVDGTEESLAKLNRQTRRTGFKDARSLLVAANHMADDPAGIRLLQRHFKQLTASVPLENAASGLIVFTQDWRVARKLEEDMGSMEHEVIVEVEGEVSDQALRLLNRLQDSDAELPQTKVSLNSTGEGTSKLRFAIKGAHRGLIAHLCERAKLEIVAMHRIRLGRVSLRGLPVGQWRYLADGERF